MGTPKSSSRAFRRKRPGNVRWGRIRTIRDAIARGTYDTPDKWEALVDRLLRDLKASPGFRFENPS
jgi:hypothetical protein